MRRRPSGISLIELIVASFIVALLMVEIWGLVRAGSRFYLRARSQGEIQRESLMAIRWISRELGEGSGISFREYSTGGGAGQASNATRPGIVFGSPTDTFGNVSYSDRGKLLWSSVICYYIETTDGVLYRQQMALPAKRTAAPTIDNDLHSPDRMAMLPKPRRIAQHMHAIETVQGPTDILVKLVSRDQQIGYGITVQTRLEMKN